MLTALVLCTQLQAAKMVTGCKAAGNWVATFTDPAGHQGILTRATSDTWPAMLAEASKGDDAGTPAVAASPWAHVIVVSIDALPQVAWWVDEVETLCASSAERVDLRAQIATEKANPSGVVDLARLHALGERLQAAEAALREFGATYLKGTGKAFSASMCSAP
jgi:hypothetical protein